MLGFKHVLPSPGQKVYIVPIKEWGKVKICRRDARDEMIIEVIRNSDGVTHLCRECEIKTQLAYYVEKATVLAAGSKQTKLVVELDDAEDRKMVVVDEDYPNYDEFHAFDGKVLASVDCEGNVES